MRHFAFKDVPFFPALKFAQMFQKRHLDDAYSELLECAKNYHSLACDLNTQLFNAETELLKLRAENEFMLRMINDRDNSSATHIADDKIDTDSSDKSVPGEY
jgi:hypothetical protein